MEIFRFKRRLRFRHPTVGPDEISGSLGMEPSTSWKVGERRIRPDGQEMGGVHEYTYWSSEGRTGEDAELLTVLASDLDYLEKRAPFLAEFRATGGRIVYYVSWFASERSGGDEIGWHLLERLAALHINLALDVYSAEVNSGEAGLHDAPASHPDPGQNEN